MDTPGHTSTLFYQWWRRGHRRHALTGVVAVAALSLLVACGSESPGPSPTAGPSADPAALDDATLTFPSWPGPRDDMGLGTCPTGPLTLSDGRYFDQSTSMYVEVGHATVVPVDGGSQVVAVFYCGGPGEGSAAQVIAFRPDGAGFAVVDQIVDTAVVTAAEGPWAFITGLTASAGSVTVDLRVKLLIGTSELTYGEVAQQRTYTWNGTSYEQTAGPTSFLTPSTVNVSLTVSDLVFAPVDAFCRTGTMDLSVTNNGSAPATDVTVALVITGLGDPGVIDCEGDVAAQGIDSALFAIGTLAAGETKTVTATLVVDTRTVEPEPTRFDFGEPFADLRVGDQRTGHPTAITIQY